MALSGGIGQQLNTSWFGYISYPDTLLRQWQSPATTVASTSASDPVWENWWWGVTTLTLPSQAGGTGSSRVKRRIKKSSEVFADEMAKIEAQLEATRRQRERIEEIITAAPATGPVPLSVQRFIIEQERRLQAEQMRRESVPVYFRLARELRRSAIERLQELARIARYREAVAEERKKKLLERMDEEAAVYLMRFLMADEQWQD